MTAYMFSVLHIYKTPYWFHNLNVFHIFVTQRVHYNGVCTIMERFIKLPRNDMCKHSQRAWE